MVIVFDFVMEWAHCSWLSILSITVIWAKVLVWVVIAFLFWKVLEVKKNSSIFMVSLCCGKGQMSCRNDPICILHSYEMPILFWPFVDHASVLVYFMMLCSWYSIMQYSWTMCNYNVWCHCSADIQKCPNLASWSLSVSKWIF